MYSSDLIIDTLDEYHPTQPLETKRAQRIRIEPGRNVNWPLIPNTYMVLKQYDRVLGHFIFFVTAGGNLCENHTSSSRLRTRYENQLAYATFKPGWIDYVWVNAIARKCGISTVLSEFGMLDPQLNQVTKDNHAIQEISTFEKNEDVEKVITYVKEHCNALVGLEMKADPLHGAYAYLSAAIRTRYTKLIIQPYDERLKRCGKIFLHYDIQIAQSKYNVDTGCIDSIRGSGYKAKWYFCQQKL